VKQPSITLRDLECLEHLRNVGRLVTEMAQFQDSNTFHRDPAQQLQLTSLVSLMTAQLDGVVERCNQHWLTGENNA